MLRTICGTGSFVVGMPAKEVRSPLDALTVLVLCVVAVGLAIILRQQNVIFLTGLTFAIAASANFPALVLSLFWRGLRHGGGGNQHPFRRDCNAVADLWIAVDSGGRDEVASGHMVSSAQPRARFDTCFLPRCDHRFVVPTRLGNPFASAPCLAKPIRSSVHPPRLWRFTRWLAGKTALIAGRNNRHRAGCSALDGC